MSRRSLTWVAKCEMCPWTKGPMGYLGAHRMARSHEMRTRHRILTMDTEPSNDGYGGPQVSR